MNVLQSLKVTHTRGGGKQAVTVVMWPLLLAQDIQVRLRCLPRREESPQKEDMQLTSTSASCVENKVKSADGDIKVLAYCLQPGD